jgi:hypothetical protein
MARSPARMALYRSYRLARKLPGHSAPFKTE